jgi:putative lipoic acid-binding regulatory protein
LEEIEFLEDEDELEEETIHIGSCNEYCSVSVNYVIEEQEQLDNSVDELFESGLLNFIKGN